MNNVFVITNTLPLVDCDHFSFSTFSIYTLYLFSGIPKISLKNSCEIKYQEQMKMLDTFFRLTTNGPI